MTRKYVQVYQDEMMAHRRCWTPPSSDGNGKPRVLMLAPTPPLIGGMAAFGLGFVIARLLFRRSK